jgi:hypothetical protein
MDRLQQKYSLFVKLGALFGPLLQIVENPDQYDEQERAETLARYFSEYHILMNEFRMFSTDQPGHNYLIEHNRFHHALDGVRSKLQSGASLADTIHAQLAEAQAAIDAVPVPRISVILEAGSPFTTYCKLKELCEVDATKSLIWLDPFLSANIFYRYVNSVRQFIPITLVTSEPGSHARAKDKNRWAEFLDVSRLYAQEHGPSHYRLVVQANLHDRWIVFDEKRIYALGGSAKDAGNTDYFTIAAVEASPENLGRIQTQIDTGIEFFGSNALQHI